MPAVHEIGEWVGGTPNLLSLPVTTFYESHSTEAIRANRMLEAKSPAVWEHRKASSVRWAAVAVAVYDKLWEDLCTR